MQLAVDATFDQKEALVFPVLEPRSQLCEPARSIEDHFYFGCWALALFASPLLWSSDHCRVTGEKPNAKRREADSALSLSLSLSASSIYKYICLQFGI